MTLFFFHLYTHVDLSVYLNYEDTLATYQTIKLAMIVNFGLYPLCPLPSLLVNIIRRQYTSRGSFFPGYLSIVSFCAMYRV